LRAASAAAFLGDAGVARLLHGGDLRLVRVGFATQRVGDGGGQLGDLADLVGTDGGQGGAPARVVRGPRGEERVVVARLLLHRLEHEAGDGGHREVVEVLVPPGEHAWLRHPATRLDQAREHVGVAAVLLPDLRQHAEQRGVLGHGVRVGLEDVARARVEAAREQVVEAATEGVGRRMRRDHRDGVEATLLGHDGSPSRHHAADEGRDGRPPEEER
jgi:hypothetical protein